MKNIKYLLLFEILILSSCNDTNPRLKEQLLIPDFPKKEKIEAEYILLPIIIAPTFFEIQANFLCTYSLRKDTIIDLFSLPDLIYTKSFGTKGRGPNEFQHYPWPCKSTNDFLYIRGYTPLIIKQFSINPSLDLEQMNEWILEEYETFGSMHIVQDSLLIYLSMGYQTERTEQISIKKYNLIKRQETGKIIIPTTSPENASIDPNRAGGFDVNDSYIVYSYLFKKQIDIYDIHSMQLICRLKDNDRKSRVILNSEHFFENIPHYSGVKAGRKYFYAIYNKKGLKFHEFEPASQTIEVFDYNGNAIVEYSFDDFISMCALDEVTHTLYAYDITKEYFILKYDLPEIERDVDER